ncbi:hypothetical protein ACF0H5_006821 [Mactra antiquata]
MTGKLVKINVFSSTSEQVSRIQTECVDQERLWKPTLVKVILIIPLDIVITTLKVNLVISSLRPLKQYMTVLSRVWYQTGSGSRS